MLRDVKRVLGIKRDEYREMMKQIRKRVENAGDGLKR